MGKLFHVIFPPAVLPVVAIARCGFASRFARKNSSVSLVTLGRQIGSRIEATSGWLLQAHFSSLRSCRRLIAAAFHLLDRG